MIDNLAFPRRRRTCSAPGQKKQMTGLLLGKENHQSCCYDTSMKAKIGLWSLPSGQLESTIELNTSRKEKTITNEVYPYRGNLTEW